MQPWSPLVKNIWWIFWQTLQYQWPFSVRSGSCPAASPNLSVFGGNLWYSAPLCILRDDMAPMETPASLWNVRTWSSAFSISGSVIFSNVSSSRSPCAILAVDAIVSTSEGWSIQDTLSVFSSSPKSSRDALAAPLVLAGMILNAPFGDMTACLNSSYWADETFLEPPLSSPLETADVFPVSSDWIA